MTGDVQPVRVAELTVALSLATDLGTGQPLEHGLRTCWLSLAAAERLGLDADARSYVYFVALLRFVGCTSDASETALMAAGDDVAFNAVMAPMLMAGSGEGMGHFVRHLGADLPMRRRVGRVVRALADPGSVQRSLAQHCEVAARLAARLGMSESVCHALAHAYERWDGKGHPGGLSGEEVPVAVRIVTVARDAELWARHAGWPAASEVLAHRRGHAYDPAVVDVVVEEGERWLGDLGDDLCAAVLAAEPGPAATISVDGFDQALVAIADFTDLKSPWLRGHSPAVARLAVSGAAAAELTEAKAAALGRAALVHDVGRVGVPNGIWDRPGPLSVEQWERVRLHPYLTERVLHRCAPLARWPPWPAATTSAPTAPATTAAAAHLEAALAGYDPARVRKHLERFGQDPGAVCLVRLAMTCWHLGRLDDAERCRDEGLARANAIGRRWTAGHAQTFATWKAVDAGALDVVDELTRAPAADGNAFVSLTIAAFGAGATAMRSGRDDATARLARCAEEAHVIQPFVEPKILLLLAAALHRVGRPAEGLDAARRARTIAVHEMPILAAEGWRTEAEPLAATGAAPEAVADALEQAMTVATAQGAVMLQRRVVDTAAACGATMRTR